MGRRSEISEISKTSEISKISKTSEKARRAKEKKGGGEIEITKKKEVRREEKELYFKFTVRKIQ